jgi:hypothetical protein
MEMNKENLNRIKDIIFKNNYNDKSITNWDVLMLIETIEDLEKNIEKAYYAGCGVDFE